MLARRTVVIWGLLMFAAWFHRASLQADETLLFYPTYAHWQPTEQQWSVQVHVSVYEEEVNSLKRKTLLAVIHELLDLSADETKSELFQARAKLFMVDHERNKELSVVVEGQTNFIGKTGANGHLQKTIALTTDQTGPTLTAGPGEWKTLIPTQTEAQQATVPGRVQFIPPRGLSIISDVDDTIKISQVTDKKALLKNTFLKPFAPITGMSQQYQIWEQQGAAFHYLSASPWQLYLPLEEFRAQEKFPAGTWSMKFFRLTDRSFIELFKNQTNYKNQALGLFLKDFPERKFVLVGDSSEQDPEIFGALARKHPKQIAKILIRDGQVDPTKTERFAKAFVELPVTQWQVFRDPKELATALPNELFATDK